MATTGSLIRAADFDQIQSYLARILGDTAVNYPNDPIAGTYGYGQPLVSGQVTRVVDQVQSLQINKLKVDILKIDDEQTHNYENCLIESFGINGYDCEKKFCDLLFTEENQGATVIAHNGAGYDNKFILQYCKILDYFLHLG